MFDPAKNKLFFQAEPTRGLRKAIEDDIDNKNKLISKYEAAKKFCMDLPNNYKKDLNSVFGSKFELKSENDDSHDETLAKPACTLPQSDERLNCLPYSVLYQCLWEQRLIRALYFYVSVCVLPILGR